LDSENLKKEIIMNRKSVGISSLAVYVPRLYLDLGIEWAQNRSINKDSESVNKLRAKAAQGIGISRISQADFHEDAVTMAANAVRKLIDQSGIDPREIASLAVGTESTVDQSKSMASYVLGLIERFYKIELSEVSTPHFQFACIGATYALEAALNTLLAGTSDKPYHIVVATDIAKYPLGSTGEPTQGAGAVAILLSENPLILEIDTFSFATCTLDESDFFRPNFAKSAVVDGKRSINVYCDSLEKATRSFLSKKTNQGLSLGDFAAYLYHVPFPKMAEYAAVRQLRTFWLSDLQYSSLLAAVKSDSPTTEELKIRRHPEFKKIYSEKIKPSLIFPEQIGNIYSGSLYLALVSFLEASLPESELLFQKDILFSSYGSGACAKVFRGILKSDWRQFYQGKIRTEIKDFSEGGRRIPIAFSQYEKLHAHTECIFAESDSILKSQINSREIMSVISRSEGVISLNQPGASICPPEDEFYLERVGTESTIEIMDVGYRYYRFASSRKNEA
jgi:hydroxymethylglutaryl-CoA synthase